MTPPSPSGERASVRTDSDAPHGQATGRTAGAAAEERRGMWADFDSGWVMSAELLSATLTWGAIGWLLDRWLGTTPWLMVVGFVVGNATGLYLVWHRSNQQETERLSREQAAREARAAIDSGRHGQ
jgi:ATP synthase protein I